MWNCNEVALKWNLICYNRASVNKTKTAPAHLHSIIPRIYWHLCARFSITWLHFIIMFCSVLLLMNAFCWMDVHAHTHTQHCVSVCVIVLVLADCVHHSWRGLFHLARRIWAWHDRLRICVPSLFPWATNTDNTVCKWKTLICCQLLCR